MPSNTVGSGTQDIKTTITNETKVGARNLWKFDSWPP